MLRRMIRDARKALARKRRERQDLRELAALKAALTGFDDIATVALEARVELEASWREYVTTVSSPIMAASLELSALILAIARIRRPRRVLDLGSGFTSYVLRSYAREAGGVTAVTVDDDTAWLERTRVFLAADGLATDEMWIWDELSKSSPQTFQLVVHDLGTKVSVRAGALPRALELTARDGLLVLDDLHSGLYRNAAPGICRRAGRRFLPARMLSLDTYGRYAAIALPR